MVWWRGWPGGGPSVQCSAFPSSAFSSRAPSPDQYRLPLLRIPSLLSLPASLPLARPPPSLPLSLPHFSPPLAPGPSAGGRRAGRQAAASEGRRRGGGSRQWAAVAAGSREAGPAGDQEPVAAPRRGPGVRGQALPPRHPRDTPPSSAFLFHLPLSILPSLVLSFLPTSPPRLPPSQLSGSSSTPSSPAPPLLGLSLPPACFFHGG